MKKKRIKWLLTLNGRARKLLLIMKLIVVLVFALVIGLSANTLSQQKVNLQMGNTTYEELFREIKKQTGHYVIYNNKRLDKDESIDVNFVDEVLDNVLKEVLKGKELVYVIKDEFIILKPAQKNKEVEQVKKIIVKGKVTDINGKPLPGVTIMIKGTNLGVATNVDGKFEISVPKMGETLIFSFIGMVTKKVVVKEEYIKVQLKETNKELDDVIVVGYQSVRKERMTGSSTTVTAKDIVGKGLTSIEEALSNSVSGLNMITSGRPGANSQIQIRGINSLNGSTEPIWIVDGMPMQGEIPNIKVGASELQSTIFTSGIGNISPNDIKSITVLKDAAATAIYGARAANGVIVIETKSGLVGKTKFNFTADFGLKERPVNNIEMMNTAQKIQFEREIYKDETAWVFEPGRVMKYLKIAGLGGITNEEAEKKISKLSKIDTDWFKEIFRDGINKQFNFSMSGGTEKTQHYTSFNYLTETGVAPNNKYSRLGMKSKITHIPNKKIRINGGIGVTVRKDRVTASLVDPLEYAMYANPYEKPYNEDGSYASDITYLPILSKVHSGLEWEDFNIIKELNDNTKTSRYIDAEISLKFEWEIIQGLMFSSHGVYNINSNHDRIVEGENTYTNFKNNWYEYYDDWDADLDKKLVKGSLCENTGYSNGYTFKNTIQYSKDFGLGTHIINLFIGQEIMERNANNFYNYSPVFDNIHNIIGFPDLKGVDATTINFGRLGNTGKNTSKISSFYGNASYSYKDRYIITGAVRYDGSDIIGNKNQFTPLWNTAIRWNLHKEIFLESFDWVNLLSFRAGFGYTGSIDKNALPFLSYTLGTSIIYDDQQVPTEFTYPNPNIKWQKKRDMNIGFDFSLLDYRIELGVNYYYNITKDLLDRRRLASSSGRTEAYANVADLYNSGVEIDLGLTVLKRKNIQWFTNLNFAYNKNKIKNSFYDSVDDLPTKITQSNGRQYVNDYPAGGWYGYRVAGINPMTGTTLVHVNNSEATYDMAEEYYDIPGNMINYLGSKTPPYVGGFSTTLNIKQFVFSASFEFKAGHKIKSFNTFKNLDSQNRHVNDLDRWRQPGDITNIPRMTQLGGLWTFYMFDQMLEKGDYLKCSQMSLGYNLKPELLKKIGLDRLSVNFTAKDLFTLTKYNGIDPLLMGEFGYPNSRKYTISLNFGF